MFQQVLTIARNTFIESVRQPIYVVILLATSAMMWLNLKLAGYTMDTGGDNKMLIDLNLGTLLMAGLALAAFISPMVLAAEIDNKTILTVISKPIARPLFIIGKYLGVALALAVAWCILGTEVLLTLRHRVETTAGDLADWPVVLVTMIAVFGSLIGAALANYYYNWIFNSTFVFSFLICNVLGWLFVLIVNKHWGFQSIRTEFLIDDGILGQTIMAVMLTLQAWLILTAVAITASTRLKMLPTFLICVIVFLISIYNDELYFRLCHDQSWSSVEGLWPSVGYCLAMVLYRVMPNLQFLYVADDLTQGNLVPGQYVLWLSSYTALFVAALLSMAVGLFQTREIS